MSQQEQHLTTEQLSTFLDQQLAPEEQALCHAHLEDCKQCQKALDNLQQTVNLLRSLPLLEVPRSFALPVDFKVDQIAAYSNEQQVEQLTTKTKASPRKLPTPLRYTFRALSALAAVIGLFFVLSGLVAILQPEVGMSLTASAPNPVSSSSGSQAREVPQATSRVPTNNENTNPVLISTPTIQVVNTPQPQSTQHVPAGANSPAAEPLLPFLDIHQSGAYLSLGVVLVILGGIGFTLFARRRIPRTPPVDKNS